MGTTRKTVGGWSFTRGTGLSDYIEIPAKGNLGKEGELMSDFEMLSIMLMVLGIVVSILIAYINHTKK
ncbi:hypothetical protein AALD74_08535 [Lachnospiraceae bacterium 48-21]|jgi:hypothetical protein|nr:hypothetical protein [Dorea sp.]